MLVIGLAGLASAVLPLQSKPRHTLVILTGDTDGYLTPCGCSDPMSGGIRRRSQAIWSQLGNNTSARPNHLVLDNGNLVSGTSRQDEIKAETMAQVFRGAPYDAINVGPADAALGKGSILAIQQLSGEKLLASSLPATSELGIQRWLVKPPFLVIGVAAEPQAIGEPLGEEASSLESTLTEGVSEAEAAGLTPILLLQGGYEKAVEIAKAFPSLALIQYRASGSPAVKQEVVGTTWLVSPGDRGRHILRLTFDGKFESYNPIELTPHIHDDVMTSHYFKTYLQRISEERLLDNLPREGSAAFAGNGTCVSCHTEAGAVWKTSAHAQALKTLEKKGHEVDPDCVGCHVVGLEKEGGFQSRQKTPELANVGCESCHGAGKGHSLKPLIVKMGKVGERSCAPCHVTDHSPGFDFKKYWETIKH